MVSIKITTARASARAVRLELRGSFRLPAVAGLVALVSPVPPVRAAAGVADDDRDEAAAAPVVVASSPTGGVVPPASLGEREPVRARGRPRPTSRRKS